MNSAADDAATLHVAQQLSASFPTVAESVVKGIVGDAHRRYAGHISPDAVSALVEETSRDRLRAHLEATSHSRTSKH